MLKIQKLSYAFCFLEPFPFSKIKKEDKHKSNLLFPNSYEIQLRKEIEDGLIKHTIQCGADSPHISWKTAQNDTSIRHTCIIRYMANHYNKIYKDTINQSYSILPDLI